MGEGNTHGRTNISPFHIRCVGADNRRAAEDLTLEL